MAVDKLPVQLRTRKFIRNALLARRQFVSLILSLLMMQPVNYERQEVYGVSFPYYSSAYHTIHFRSLMLSTQDVLTSVRLSYRRSWERYVLHFISDKHTSFHRTKFFR